MINVLQIGLGSIGIKTAEYIADKSKVNTIVAVDINTDLEGKSLHELSNKLSSNTFIYNSVERALDSLDKKPDVAIITTVSSLEILIPQIEEVAKFEIPVVSTCEELSYPWKLHPELSRKLDVICKAHNIACLGTGVNPGFLMDYLPSVLTSVCMDIERVIVERVQDATSRRIPFQKKIGAGLNLKDFKKKESEGTLRHVGLKESVYLLAKSVGFNLDHVTESLEPVIAEKDVSSKAIKVKKGDARGVEQIAHGYVNGSCKVEMHFKAAIGEVRSYDKITIKGTPTFSSEIDGGIDGDIATCAITINSINSILRATAGLHTMADISVPGFIN
jgi:4-hydroxy-tetrahydrodipicolinate reductase